MKSIAIKSRSTWTFRWAAGSTLASEVLIILAMFWSGSMAIQHCGHHVSLATHLAVGTILRLATLSASLTNGVGKPFCRTNRTCRPMSSIRIIAIPPGEAPQEVREAWLDLTLPLPDGSKGTRRTWNVVGVLSGPKSYFTGCLAFLFGKFDRKDGYAVNGAAAVAELEKKNPPAAAWWRQNAAHCLEPSRMLVFPKDVCELH